MNGRFEQDVEDVESTLAAGLAPRGHGPYGVLIGNERLEFKMVVIADPVSTGSQILTAAGVTQSMEHLVYQLLSNGLLEELRPDETTDLRVAGVERFLVFRSDRSFRFRLNDQTSDWGATHITGATLKRLAGVKANTHDVWREVVGGDDRLIADREFADLTSLGIERFITKPISIRIVVNARQREVHRRHLSYWDVVKLAFPDAVPAENTVYTVNYARGPHANPEGSIVAGQYVHVKDGMTFYVTVTDKS